MCVCVCVCVCVCARECVLVYVHVDISNVSGGVGALQGMKDMGSSWKDLKSHRPLGCVLYEWLKLEQEGPTVEYVVTGLK